MQVDCFERIEKRNLHRLLEKRTNLIKDGDLVFCLLLLFISVCYTALRVSFNHEMPISSGASHQQLYDLVAAIPFGNRILIPLLARPLAWCGVSVNKSFQILEVVATLILLWGLYQIFSMSLSNRWARVLTVGFIFVLPLVFLLDTPECNLMPYDTPAMAFIIFGIYFLLQSKWHLTAITLFFATLNRESSVLIPLLFASLYIFQLPARRFVQLALYFFGIYLTTRWMITFTTTDNIIRYPHLLGQMSYTLLDGTPRIINNLEWVTRSPANLFTFCAIWGGMPLAFLFNLKNMPWYMRKFGLVSIIYFAMLSAVGNYYEPRIFGEIAAILFVPVAFGMYTYLTQANIEPSAPWLREEGNLLQPLIRRLVTCSQRESQFKC